MPVRSRDSFANVRTEGGILPPDLLARILGATVHESTPARAGASSRESKPVEIDLAELPRAARDALGPDAAGKDHRIRGRFSLPVQPGELYLSRTHPVIEGLATHLLATALDPLASAGNPTGMPGTRRCGVVRTRAVTTSTTLRLVR